MTAMAALRRLSLILSLSASLFLARAIPARAEVLAVTVTQPWLALLVSFIGGPNVEVRSLQEWNADGELAPPAKKMLRALPKDERLIALDAEEARQAGLKAEEFLDLRMLYAPFPVETEGIDTALSDPSVLPFVAQRVLTALSDWDPSNYPYYQRRLAEFQARLSSSILAGRQLLHDTPVYDLTGSAGVLLQAAGCRIGRPSPEQRASWSKGDLAGLADILAARQEAKAVVVTDWATARPLRKYLSNRPGTFHLARPSPGQDYPAFLHDQYISLWLRVTARPLPAQDQDQDRGRGRRR